MYNILRVDMTGRIDTGDPAFGQRIERDLERVLR